VTSTARCLGNNACKVCQCIVHHCLRIVLPVTDDKIVPRPGTLGDNNSILITAVTHRMNGYKLQQSPAMQMELQSRYHFWDVASIDTVASSEVTAWSSATRTAETPIVVCNSSTKCHERNQKLQRCTHRYQRSPHSLNWTIFYGHSRWRQLTLMPENIWRLSKWLTG